MRNAKFMIGELVFEVSCAEGAEAFEIPDSYQPFVNEASGADFCLTSRGGGIPSWSGELVFDSLGAWKLWRAGEQFLISMHSSTHGKGPYQIALIDEDFSAGTTYTDNAVTSQLPGYFPFTYPLDEVLSVNLLARGHGLEVHASGVSDGGAGVLFLGVSGSGKSTFSRLWDADERVTVLSDDRIIITQRDGGFWIHGTPWHGDAGLADPAGVPLKAVFFIGHADANSASRLKPAQVASRLMARSFPTFWNEEGMNFSTGLAAGLAQALPGYQMGFVPEPDAVEYVRNIIGGG